MNYWKGKSKDMARTKYSLENNPIFAGLEDQETDSEAEEKRKRGRPKKDNLVRDNSVQEGLTEDYTRATFIVRVSLLEKLKNYAYTDRLSMKDAIDKLLTEALDREEKRLNKQGSKLLDRNGGKS